MIIAYYKIINSAEICRFLRGVFEGKSKSIDLVDRNTLKKEN
jgi:hypothetical protein